jgi:hypothetical protein
MAALSLAQKMAISASVLTANNILGFSILLMALYIQMNALSVTGVADLITLAGLLLVVLAVEQGYATMKHPFPTPLTSPTRPRKSKSE